MENYLNRMWNLYKDTQNSRNNDKQYGGYGLHYIGDSVEDLARKKLNKLRDSYIQCLEEDIVKLHTKIQSKDYNFDEKEMKEHLDKCMNFKKDMDKALSYFNMKVTARKTGNMLPFLKSFTI